MGASFFLHHIHVSGMAGFVLEDLPSARLCYRVLLQVSTLLSTPLILAKEGQLGSRRHVFRLGAQLWRSDHLSRFPCNFRGRLWCWRALLSVSGLQTARAGSSALYPSGLKSDCELLCRCNGVRHHTDQKDVARILATHIPCR